MTGGKKGGGPIALYSRTGMSLAIRLSGIAINFAALIVLARALDPQTLGQYSYAIELIALLCVLSAFGFNMIAIRIVPDRLVERDRTGFLRFTHAGLLAGVLGAFLFGIAVYLSWWAGWLVPGVGTTGIVLIVAVLFTFTALRFLQEVMRAASRIVLAQIVEQVIWPLALLGLALALLLRPISADALVFVLQAQALVFGLASIALLVVARRHVDGFPPVERAIVDDKPKRWLAMSLPLAWSATLIVFLNRGDIIALGSLGEASDVAFYTPASRYAAFMVLGQAAASMAAAATMREFWHSGDKVALQNCIGQMAAISVLFALPFFLLYLAFPQFLLGLFGADFVVAANVLRILAIAQLVNCWTGPIATAVVACELERPYAILVAASAAIMVLLLVLLIPEMGMAGAAISTLASLALLNTAMAWLIWRQTGLRCWLDREAVSAVGPAAALAFRGAWRRIFG